MKIRSNVPLSKLTKYGFSKPLVKPRVDDYDMEVDAEAIVYYDDCWEYDQRTEALDIYDYFYEVGEGRRGQYYYIGVTAKDRVLSVIATKPDGDGCETALPNILIDMLNDDILEKL